MPLGQCLCLLQVSLANQTPYFFQKHYQIGVSIYNRKFIYHISNKNFTRRNPLKSSPKARANNKRKTKGKILMIRVVGMKKSFQQMILAGQSINQLGQFGKFLTWTLRITFRNDNFFHGRINGNYFVNSIIIFDGFTDVILITNHLL